MPYVRTKDVPKYLQQALHTSKRKVGVFFQNEITLAYGFWDEGSRSEYWMIDLLTGKVEALAYPTNPPQFGGKEPPTIEIPIGKSVCSGGYTFGKECMVSLHIGTGLIRETPYVIVADHLESKGFGDIATMIRTIGSN